MSAPRTVEDLQRELLAIARGGSFAETWRKVNAVIEWPSLRNEISKISRLNALRRQIVAIDPKACLYYGWGGHGDTPPEPNLERRRDGDLLTTHNPDQRPTSC